MQSECTTMSKSPESSLHSATQSIFAKNSRLNTPVLETLDFLTSASMSSGSLPPRAQPSARTVNPEGTGRPMRAISARFAPAYAIIWAHCANVVLMGSSEPCRWSARARAVTSPSLGSTPFLVLRSNHGKRDPMTHLCHRGAFWGLRMQTWRRRHCRRRSGTPTCRCRSERRRWVWQPPKPSMLQMLLRPWL